MCRARPSRRHSTLPAPRRPARPSALVTAYGVVAPRQRHLLRRRHRIPYGKARKFPVPVMFTAVNRNETAWAVSGMPHCPPMTKVRVSCACIAGGRTPREAGPGPRVRHSAGCHGDEGHGGRADHDQRLASRSQGFAPAGLVALWRPCLLRHPVRRRRPVLDRIAGLRQRGKRAQERDGNGHGPSHLLHFETLLISFDFSRCTASTWANRKIEQDRGHDADVNIGRQRRGRSAMPTLVRAASDADVSVAKCPNHPERTTINRPCGEQGARTGTGTNRP